MSNNSSVEPANDERPQQTRCPECNGHFTITSAQLSTAGGLVRCGNCKNVFNASEHLLDIPELTIAAPHQLATDDTAHSTIPAADPKHAAPTVNISRASIVESLTSEAAGVKGSARKPSFPWFASAISLVLCLVLLAQYLSFNWLALSQRAQQDDQSLLLKALNNGCELAGCELPPPRDLASLQSDSLHISEHADFQNSLQADMILYNRSNRELLAPQLRLSFSDISGLPIASRNFTPSEYLFGELKGLTLLPPNSEIRIQLNLLDPNPDAVNYQLNLSYPDQKPSKVLKLLNFDFVKTVAKALNL